MKARIIFLILALLMTGTVYLSAAESYPPEGWITDITEAKETAMDEDKMIVVNFTGSDWCGWCEKLRDEVFTTGQFRNYADDNLVLLFLDFPSAISLSENQQVHNSAIAQLMGVRGYPTIIVLDSDLTPRLKTGYTGASAMDYAAHLTGDTNITPESAEAVRQELERIIPLLPEL